MDQLSPETLTAIDPCLGMLGVVAIFIWGPPLPDFEESVGLAVEDGTVFADGTKAADIIAANKRAGSDGIRSCHASASA